MTAKRLPHCQQLFFVWGSAVLIVGSLYLARAVLIPIVLSILLAFILTPLVLWFERRRVGRTASVLIVVALACLAILCLAGLVMMQVQSLAAEIPKYKDTITAKIENAYESGRSAFSELSQTVTEISEKLKKIETPPPAQEPVPVTVEQSPYLRWLQSTIGTTLEILLEIGLVIILVTFILLAREDLRNRFIRLSGMSSLASTTYALDDAQRRISRYLIMQLIVNGSYGAMAGIALWLLGVPYAFLWGFLTAVLRYIPYVGPWLGAIFPLALAIAVFEDWTTFFLAAGMFIVLELFSNNVMETWLYGNSIGVSSLAVLLAAVFWTWLWGPLGLVLSTPLTACLIVLARHVPAFGFFEVLLGDHEVLPTHMIVFQRLLAKDEDEAWDLVRAETRRRPTPELYDEVLLPVLQRAKATESQGELSPADLQFIHKAIEQVLDDLPAAAPSSEEPEAPRALVFGCPVRDLTDELAAKMFGRLLDPAKYDYQPLSSETLLGELVTRLNDERPEAVCLFAVPPGGVTRARLLCQRLRRELPELKILVLCWRKDDDDPRWREPFAEVQVSGLATTLLELHGQLNGLSPVLAAQAEEEALAAET